MAEGSYDSWLKSVPVLWSGEAHSRYAEWLDAAGARVTHALEEDKARQLVVEEPSGFFAAVLDADSPLVDWMSLSEAVPPSCGLVIVSTDADASMLRRVHGLGAQFLSRAANQADFMFAMSHAVSLSGPNLRRLAARAASMWRLPRQLSRLLYYNLWSYSDQEIADAMGLSRHTVQQYQEELRKRTGVRTKHAYLRRLLACAGARPPLSMSDETLARMTLDRRGLGGAVIYPEDG